MPHFVLQQIMSYYIMTNFSSMALIQDLQSFKYSFHHPQKVESFNGIFLYKILCLTLKYFEISKIKNQYHFQTQGST